MIDFPVSCGLFLSPMGEQEIGPVIEEHERISDIQTEKRSGENLGYHVVGPASWMVVQHLQGELLSRFGRVARLSSAMGFACDI